MDESAKCHALLDTVRRYLPAVVGMDERALARIMADDSGPELLWQVLSRAAQERKQDKDHIRTLSTQRDELRLVLGMRYEMTSKRGGE
jgi:hypothetical protein